jgi:hypothetical protein
MLDVKVALFSFLVVLAALATPRVAADAETATVEQQARAPVVLMTMGTSSCSAVVIAPGEALTAWHCFQQNAEQVLVQNGLTLKIRAWTRYGKHDLAYIKVPGLECPCAKPLQGKAVMDEPVIVVGYPYNIGQVLTRGDVQEYTEYEGVVFRVITAPAAPGNSGGGAFVIRNGIVYLLGIVSQRATAGSITLIVEPPQ